MINQPSIDSTPINGFKLFLQLIADDFTNKDAQIEIIAKDDSPRLEGLRLFQPGKPLVSRYLYALVPGMGVPAFNEYEGISFLSTSALSPSIMTEDNSFIIIEGSMTFAEVLNTVQQTFDKYFAWDRNLRMALSADSPLEEMIEASLEVFNNPTFVHDTNFYILSSPRHVEGMSVWVEDKRTGKLITPLSLIQDFKLEPEYQRTLTTHGPDIYAADMRGYRILYMNLWVDGKYEGRICVDELQTPITPGQSYVLQYLGALIEMSIKQHNLFQLSMGNDIRQFLTDMLEGSITDMDSIRDNLFFLNWKQQDRYLVLKFEAQAGSDQLHSAVATLGHIEAQLPEGRAFIYDKGIVAIANLSFTHSTTAEVLSLLAIIIREGLYKLGASSEVNDFMFIRQGYMQAVEALRLGKESGSMRWCYTFDEYLLDFLMSECTKRISPQSIAASRLAPLIKYDAKNNTDLYHTLKVYLENERNVLATSKLLFIHRSTLFYRLERIEKIIQIDLDNYKERLILQICFQLLGDSDTISGDEGNNAEADQSKARYISDIKK